MLAALLQGLVVGPSCKRFSKPDVARLCRDEGSAADAVSGVCVDKKTFVSCDAEHVQIPCRGPKGCTGDGVGLLHSFCDVSGDQNDDRCVWSNRHHDQCGADGESVVVCEMGLGAPDRYAIIPCRGPKGCVSDAGKGEPICDDSVGFVGETCEPMSGACSRHQALLVCDSPLARPGPGHWKVERMCRGPRGCELTPTSDGSGFSISCDDDISVIGDSCTFDGKSAQCRGDGTPRMQGPQDGARRRLQVHEPPHRRAFIVHYLCRAMSARRASWFGRWLIE